MSEVYFISDLHFGHKRILNFSPERGGSTTDEHDDWIVKQWNSVVTKRDVVYVLGDIAFSHEGLDRCSELRGIKKAILGNHDQFPIDDYLQHFRLLPSLYKYKGYWLSHPPIHPAELRGKKNIHGHVHSQSINDEDFINVCVEMSDGIPRTLEQLTTSK